ncbi:MAG: hypothetical protein GY799_21100 [Desulfobulbaceae bacterium]|nr:hypothetical protein [Desulfobulbaceae bacterium]
MEFEMRLEGQKVTVLINVELMIIEDIIFEGQPVTNQLFRHLTDNYTDKIIDTATTELTSLGESISVDNACLIEC